MNNNLLKNMARNTDSRTANHRYHSSCLAMRLTDLVVPTRICQGSWLQPSETNRDLCSQQEMYWEEVRRQTHGICGRAENSACSTGRIQGTMRRRGINAGLWSCSPPFILSLMQAGWGRGTAEPLS